MRLAVKFYAMDYAELISSTSWRPVSFNFCRSIVSESDGICSLFLVLGLRFLEESFI